MGDAGTGVPVRCPRSSGEVSCPPVVGKARWGVCDGGRCLFSVTAVGKTRGSVCGRKWGKKAAWEIRAGQVCSHTARPAVSRQALRRTAVGGGAKAEGNPCWQNAGERLHGRLQLSGPEADCSRFLGHLSSSRSVGKTRESVCALEEKERRWQNAGERLRCCPVGAWRASQLALALLGGAAAPVNGRSS
jgi:hypothetical protein